MARGSTLFIQQARDNRVNQLMPGPGETVVGGANGPAKSRDLVRLNGRAPLKAWYAALAKVATTPADLLHIGTSLTEGGAMTSRTNRWQALLRDKLRARYQPAGVTGGEGYVPGYYVYGTLTDPWTGAIGVDTSFGLGRRDAVLNSTNTTISLTVTCTSFDLFYAKWASGGNFTVSIDGGAGTTLNSTNATQVDGVKWNSGALTAGSHTITITRTTGTINICGVMVYNGDETKGIRMWDGGRGGADSLTFVDPSAPRWLDNVTTIQPALVTIELGANDYSTNIAPATFQSRVQTLIANVRGACTLAPSIALIVAHQRGDAPSAQYPWQSYVDALYTIAASDGNLAVLDLGPRTIGTPWNYGIVAADKVHLADPAGSVLWANALAAFLEP